MSELEKCLPMFRWMAREIERGRLRGTVHVPPAPNRRARRKAKKELFSNPEELRRTLAKVRER